MEESEERIRNALVESGLTISEAKTYLFLLKYGVQKATKIAEKTLVSLSKIYDVIERLKEKGLVGEVKINGVKHFKANPPVHLISYIEKKEETLKRKKNELEKLLPLIKNYSAEETEVFLFKGKKSLKPVFYDILREMKKREEYYVYGISNLDRDFEKFIDIFHFQRSLRGIKAKMIIDIKEKELGKKREGLKFTKVKYMNINTSSAYQVYKDKVLITIQGKEPVMILIKNREVAENFRKTFKKLWDQEGETLRGKEGIAELCNRVVEEGKDLYLIGANAEIFKRYKKLWKEFEKKRIKKKIKRFHLAIEETRGLEFNSYPMTEVKYLSNEMKSPYVIWVFGDYVAHVLWGRTELIFIVKNKTMAKAYLNYFKLLSKIAKK